MVGILDNGWSDTDNTFDVVVRIVVRQLEIFVLESKDVVDGGIDVHFGQRTWFARELQTHLLQMVEIDVGVACRVHEIAGAESADLRHHHREKGITGDVEGNAEEGVCTALIELAGKPSVGNVELEQHMARRQVHVIQIGNIPCGDYHAPRIGRVLDLVYHLLNLVDVSPAIVGPRTPLVAVDVSEPAVGICPFIPNTHAVVLQILDVGIAAKEPYQFVDDGFQMQFLGRQQGKSVFQAETHLVAKDRNGTRAGAVAFLHTFRQNAVQQVKILFHGEYGLWDGWNECSNVLKKGVAVRHSFFY